VTALNIAWRTSDLVMVGIFSDVEKTFQHCVIATQNGHREGLDVPVRDAINFPESIYQKHHGVHG